MSCWFLIKDSNSDLSEKTSRFKEVFKNASPYAFNFDEKKIDNKNSFFTWSWNNLGLFPDISYCEQDNIHLVLDGFISDFGKHGESYYDNTKNVKKVIELFKSGKNFVEELNGSFCIIIYDNNSKELFLFNDRMSSRPIWYNQESENFYAANFSSSIAVIKNAKPAVSEVGLWSLLAAGRHTGEKGLFEGINNLPSGSILSISDKCEIKTTKWFSLNYSPDYKYTNKQWGERLAGELQTSAQRILKHYKDINLFLSGGMDSRIAAAAFGDRISSITLTTRDNKNSKISQKVAEACGMPHSTTYRDDYWYLNSFPSSALLAGGNYKLTHAHFSGLFGRDDKYFGYTYTLGDLLENFNKHYYKMPVSSLDAASFIKNFNKVYSYSVKDYKKLELLFKDGYGKKIRARWEDNAIEEAEKIEKVSEFMEDFADAYFRWQNNTICPTYLMHENIRPYANLVNLMFDNDLFATLLSMPHEIKSTGKLHNEILRNLNSKLLWIPNSNYWLPPVVPSFLNNLAKKTRPHIGKIRRKFVARAKHQPHSSPLILTEGSWDMLHQRYKKDQAYKCLIEDTFFDTSIFHHEIFNIDHIRNSWESFCLGDKDRQNEIDHLFSFGLLQNKLK